VGVVEKMRAAIEALGGEIRFQSRVDNIDIDQGQVRGVILANGERIATEYVILAVGHSARDTFQMLFDRGVYIEAKSFSIGFRSSTAAASAKTWATRYSAPPITNWCITAKMAARFTASACVPAAPWSPPPRSRAAS
jgi:uncharacterized FAD-dependent dehydrogenase